MTAATPRPAVRLRSFVTQDQGDSILLTVPATAVAARIARVGAAGLATRAGFGYQEVEAIRLAVAEGAGILTRGTPSGAHDGSLLVTYHVDAAGLRVELRVEDRTAAPVPVPELAAAVLDHCLDSWQAWPDERRVVLRKLHADADDEHDD